MNAKRLPVPEDLLLLNLPDASQGRCADASGSDRERKHLPRYFDEVPDLTEPERAHCASRWPDEIEGLAPLKLDGGFALLPKDGDCLPVCLYLPDEGMVPAEDAFLPELQVLAASGVAVLWRDGAQEPFDFLDRARHALPRLDLTRVCLWGVGLGGWNALELLAERGDLRAAILQGALTNASTAYGASAAVPYRNERSLLSFYQAEARRSPLVKVDSIRTPCLILHGQNDRRCGLEQGEQIYSALKDRCPDVPARMVVFPGEGHILQNPRHRSQALKAMIDWMEKYLKQEEAK